MMSRRLFFAHWLDEPAARAAHAAARSIAGQVGGRVMAPESLHLTLAFLGDTAEERLPELISLAGPLAATAPPFTLRLDGFGYWPHNHIVWASCREIAAPLRELAGAFKRELGAHQFPTEARPFHPHVTLLRKVRAPPPALDAMPPFETTVNEFRLVESVSLPGGGIRHDALVRWPLVGTPQPAEPKN